MPEDKKPHDEFDPSDADHLLDDDDEIDIEALLDDDDDLLILDDDVEDEDVTAASQKKSPAPSQSRAGADRDDVAEVTAKDLLDDDDLLDLGDDEDDSGVRHTVAASESAREADDATAALLDGFGDDDGDDEIDLGGSAAEEAPAEATTASLGDPDDDPTAFLGDDDDLFADDEEPAGEDPTAALGDADDDPTAVLGGDDEQASAAKPEKSKKKTLAKAKGAKKKPARPAPKGKKTLKRPEKKSEKKPAAKIPAKKFVRKPEKKPAPVRQSAGSGSIAFICSECYEEFMLPTNYAQEAVTCPECLHVGKRPDDNFLNTVLEHKKGEKTSFATVLLVGALALVSALFWIWSASPYSTMELDDTMRYGVMGVTGLLAVILIWLIVKFEGNRWEVYF